MESFGLFGYALSSAAYLVFALLIIAARNDSLLARWVLVSAIVTFASNLIAALQIKLGYGLQWVMFVDGFKIAAWSILILLFNTEHRSIRKFITDYYVRQYLVVWSSLLVFFWLLSYWLDYVYIFLLFVILNLWMLVLLEQLVRNANLQIRRAIWPLVIALAGVAIFDFVLYAQAMMVDGIDFEFWYSRGGLSLFVVPLLLVSTRRIKNGEVRVFVSRSVVFYSSMLMIAGAYLLLMALAGYVINYIGGEWGSLVSIAFLLLSGFVLVGLLITEAFRRKVKVFIAKNFFANKYEYRNEWLDLIEKIEMSSSGSYYELATQVMISKVDALGGVIIRQTAQDQFEEKFSIGVKLDQQFYEDLMLLCHFCDKNRWIVDIHEYNLDANAYPGLFLHPQTWENSNVNIIVPISIGKKFYGLFLLARGHEKSPLNWEDRDLLFAVSKQLSNFISLNEANEKIAESKQFDAFNRMSAFLVHDLKNVQAQLALITTNAEKHRDNPEFVDDVFDTVESATGRLEKVLSQLRKKQVEQRMDNYASLSSIIEKVIAQSNVQLPCVHFEFKGDGNTTIDSESFTSVIHHLIQNAQEATDKSGWVKVILNDNPQTIGITIEDNGCGMSEEFINTRLFKPFDTTKGNAGMGIGVFEAKQFFESVSGTITVISKEGSGTLFSISLPKVNNLDDQ